MASVEDLQALVGKRGAETTLQVDKSMIRLYCDCIGDSSPKWKDVAPPGMLTGVLFMGQGTPMEFPYPGIVDGGGEWEFFKPVRPGDVLSMVNELSNVEDKSSEKGKRLLISMKTTLKNQRGELVATSTGRVMNIG